jgi:heat shock protein HslJ
VVLVGCTTYDEPAPSTAPHQLTQQTWNLVEITRRDGQSVRLSPAQQVRHQLQFAVDGSLALTLDCNRGNSKWTAAQPEMGSGKLTIGPVASTRALCPSPSYGEQMAADLDGARGYTIQPDSSVLNILTQDKVYIFAAVGVATQLPGDALVPGTDYHATASIGCAFTNYPNVRSCEAGVKRKWKEDGTTLVEVKKPDGRTRAIFFRGTSAYGADGAQADGSAGWTFKATRRNYETLIQYGPESYVIPDALVVGG